MSASPITGEVKVNGTLASSSGSSASEVKGSVLTVESAIEHTKAESKSSDGSVSYISFVVL